MSEFKFKTNQLVPRRNVNHALESRRFRINEVQKMRAQFIAEKTALGMKYPEAVRAYDQSQLHFRNQAYVRGAIR